MKKLYIIGNGFDRYHGLDTRYQAFAFFLQDKYYKIHDYLVEYYGLPYLDRENDEDFYDPLWAEFEKALADLNFQDVLDNNSDYLANPASDDFRDGDWDTYAVEMQSIVDDLTKNLFKAFKEFILQVSFPDDISEKKLFLDKQAFYLNFNYTNTLEWYYDIPESRIIYIHNKANDPSSLLILGHGINPDNFKIEDEKPPEGLSEDELFEWRERMADDFDLSYERGKDELMSYFGKSFKETSRVIEENRTFFNSINNVSDIIILGHSLSEVDMPYLIEVFKSIKSDATWAISFYLDGDKEIYEQRIMDLGVMKEKIRLIRIEDLKSNNE